MTPIHQSLKQHLRKWDNSWTIIAKKLGVTRPTLSRTMNGHTEISIDLALAIEENYGWSAYEILAAQIEEQLIKRKKERNET